jgi:2-haloacid dehalogenase
VFARLHKRFLRARCANGNIALSADVAGRHNLRNLRSEIAPGYTPRPATGDAFNVKPEQVMMCAAHRPYRAAREDGPGAGETEPRSSFGVVGKKLPRHL